MESKTPDFRFSGSLMVFSSLRHSSALFPGGLESASITCWSPGLGEATSSCKDVERREGLRHSCWRCIPRRFTAPSLPVFGRQLAQNYSGIGMGYSELGSGIDVVMSSNWCTLSSRMRKAHVSQLSNAVFIWDRGTEERSASHKKRICTGGRYAGEISGGLSLLNGKHGRLQDGRPCILAWKTSMWASSGMWASSADLTEFSGTLRCTLANAFAKVWNPDSDPAMSRFSGVVYCFDVTRHG
jgi:hypothetical protein